MVIINSNAIIQYIASCIIFAILNPFLQFFLLTSKAIIANTKQIKNAAPKSIRYTINIIPVAIPLDLDKSTIAKTKNTRKITVNK